MRYLYLCLIIPFLLTACAIEKDQKSSPEIVQEDLVLRPASFATLQGWDNDNHGRAMEAFFKSCERMQKRRADQPFGDEEFRAQYSLTYGDWQKVCAAGRMISPQFARGFFEQYFIPYKATINGASDKGLFTGYYEASLKGSETMGEPYVYPLYARPDDLVMVDLGQFRDSLKGERIAGRVIDGNLKPYEERAEIEAGEWPHNDKVLVWVDDPVAAFFLHIQGSGVVALDDGQNDDKKEMRVGYAGQNGHPYYAIGRELIARGELTKENVSLQSIRAWLANHPDQSDEIMNTNKSYVFFRELDTNGPVGGEGVTLTPRRSLAIDHSKMPYGIPLWVDIDPPVQGAEKLQQLMIAQDTGGAIRGPVRGDVFWGHGDFAEDRAGKMKSQGSYWLLLPKKNINIANTVLSGGDAQQ